MERQRGFRKADVAGNLTSHGESLHEKADLPPRRNVASTPSPMPSAENSPPSPTRYVVQKLSKSLSRRLYRLTVRSRTKSATIALLSSLNDSNTGPGSMSNHS